MKMRVVVLSVLVALAAAMLTGPKAPSTRIATLEPETQEALKEWKKLLS